LQLLRKLALAHTHMMVCPLVYYDYALLRIHLLHCRYFPSLFHGILLVICSLIFYHDKGRSCLRRSGLYGHKYERLDIVNSMPVRCRRHQVHIRRRTCDMFLVSAISRYKVRWGCVSVRCASLHSRLRRGGAAERVSLLCGVIVS
jgi:hypothetical protein